MGRIRTVLVANRGEIARRILRTCHDLGLSTVAVYSEADRSLPHVAEADRAVCIGPPPAMASYLSIDAILSAAQRTGAEAVHPGYGFLAENPAFAAAVEEAGLVWIGPPPGAIRAIGDKAAARALAERLGVPTIPGYNGEDPSDAAFQAAAARIGYPVLVKTAAGGGGRGMRRVERPEDLLTAIASARREAESSFGNGALLLERYLVRPRHVEVQVLCDRHGGAVHLFERECSIQRRHQKIVEEAPSPAVDAERRAWLGEAAVRLARAVGYVGAGTVEFLLDETGSFFFLEMNTRLQVEHPVTELITGLDLVWLQIAVAEGERLPFGQEHLRLNGHAIEARLYAEDPVRDYVPTSGTLLRLALPQGEGIRVDAGYEAGNEVGVHYDAMLAKILAWGPTRTMATERLRRALGRAWVPGVATNLPLLREIFAHSGWAEGDLDTHFLERHGMPSPPPLNLRRGALAATALAWWLRREAGVWPRDVPPGWRLEGPSTSRDRWQSAGEEVEVSWRAVGADRLAVTVRDGQGEPESHELCILGRKGDELRLEIDGIHHPCRVACRTSQGAPRVGPLEDGDVVYLHLGDGESVVSLVPRHPAPLGVREEPGTCTAPMPGKVVRVNVAVGDSVRKGQALVTLEAMKMEHVVTAPQNGVVTAVTVVEGEQVAQGKVLVRIGEERGETSPADAT
jgi:acetyl-CoA carboxylase biotin carboxylase subunit